MWTLLYSKKADQDSLKLSNSGLKAKTEKLLSILAEDPFANPPSYEKLLGTSSAVYSRRINIQHRLVYSVDKKLREVKIIRMWTHYE